MTTAPVLTLIGIETQDRRCATPGSRRWFTGLFPIPMDIRTECIEA